MLFAPGSVFRAAHITPTQGTIMPRKSDQATLDRLIIRRAMHNASGEFDVCFSEFTATWNDPKTNTKVDFTGTIDSQIALKTAQIQGSDEVHELRKVFTDAELRAFNYLVNSEQVGRSRFAA
jgi:hypothetical protein